MECNAQCSIMVSSVCITWCCDSFLFCKYLLKTIFIQIPFIILWYTAMYPDSKVHGAKMGPTWILSAPDGPHVGPMNLAIRVAIPCEFYKEYPSLLAWAWYIWLFVHVGGQCLKLIETTVFISTAWSFKSYIFSWELHIFFKCDVLTHYVIMVQLSC